MDNSFPPLGNLLEEFSEALKNNGRLLQRKLGSSNGALSESAGERDKNRNIMYLVVHKTTLLV